ncbi:MAG: Arginase [Leifsonia sp.]|jgi:arginase|nr:Arginase [Leifsonia sp.]
MRLIDGANAIRGDLPASATRVVEIPMEAGDTLDTGVQRYSSLVIIRERATAELRHLDGAVITVGGDCASDLASVQHAIGNRDPGDVALVWLDAHGDINDAASSPSGAFHGMVLRAILGDAPDGLTPHAGQEISATSVILAGTRALDDGESDFVDSSGVQVVLVDDLQTPDALLAALGTTGATSVYLHIDLDVLDPATMLGIGYPEPFGLQPDQLCDLIRAVRGRFELAGAAVMEFAPETPDAANHDLPVILRILGALTSTA